MVVTGAVDAPVKAKAGIVGVITAGGCRWGMLRRCRLQPELGMLLKLVVLLLPEMLLGGGQLTGHGCELSRVDSARDALRRYP